MKSKKQKRNLRDRFGTLLFITLVLSVIYSLVRSFLAPDVAPADSEFMHVKSDYMLMFLQCSLGLVVLGLPSLVTRKWNLTLPNFIYILYYIFLYCAIFLGEVFAFYYLVPFWDSILHFFSGAMLGALGFILVSWLNDAKIRGLSLSPAFVALFAFCFALSCGVVWEIYEYTFDGLLGLNMQKFVTASGEVLAGREALSDTMKDIIVDALAAGLIAIIGFFRLCAVKKELPEAAKN
ncbi:MAG: hypothetical protein GX096_15720 [Clostridiales bacterium]|nr:hypothetical protein [Clostridiales bacterium]